MAMGMSYPRATVSSAGGFTVHAEQSSIADAWMNGEEGIDLIAVTAAPCGYCRQFLNELTQPQRTRRSTDTAPS